MAKIKGIDTDKIDEAIINKHLERYGISCTGKLNRKLRVLATHISDLKGQLSEEEFDSCKCSECGGESPGILVECPFCGDADTVDPEDVAAVAAEPEPEVVPESEPETAAEPEPEAEEAAEPEPEPEKVEKPAAKTPKKRSAAKKKLVADRKAAKEKAEKAETGEAIVIDGPAVLTQFGEVDLNQSVAKCRGFMADATLECFRLGQELNHISDNNLYLLRLGENSKSVYTNFKVFVRNEFGMSHQQAYNLMAVAANFTEDQVRQIGTTKLNLALKVPEDMREKILAAASEGDTMSSLSEKADELLNRDTPAKKPPVGKALTAIIAMGLMEAPMYKAPTQPGKVGEATSPANALNDEPFAVFTLENGVEATFQVLKNDEGDLVASLAFRRGTD